MNSRAAPAKRPGPRVVALPPKGELSCSGIRFAIVGLEELLAAALADVEDEISARAARK